MIIADKLKVSNRAEYLLYMWQVEDLIRAYAGDAECIAKEYVAHFQNLDDEKRKATEKWYADLCEMMRSEGKMQGGHLQICCNILQELSELNQQLLASSKFPYYREMYYKVLPYVVELRKKQAQTDEKTQEPELETCFNLLYGVWMLRLQKKPVSEATEKAAKDVSALLGQLSDYYFKDKKEPIDF